MAGKRGVGVVGGRVADLFASFRIFAEQEAAKSEVVTLKKLITDNENKAKDHSNSLLQYKAKIEAEHGDYPIFPLCFPLCALDIDACPPATPFPPFLHSKPPSKPRTTKN